MCIGPDSGVLLPAIAVATALFLSVAFAVWRFVEGARAANDANAWTTLMQEQGPALFVNGLWLFIGYLAVRSCGIVP